MIEENEELNRKMKCKKVTNGDSTEMECVLDDRSDKNVGAQESDGNGYSKDSYSDSKENVINDKLFDDKNEMIDEYKNVKKMIRLLKHDFQ